jgi:hypothetical protein
MEIIVSDLSRLTLVEASSVAVVNAVLSDIGMKLEVVSLAVKSRRRPPLLHRPRACLR